ncbi:hypothetical protein STAS_10050 [Striga asiatica]|uniref:Uncharacterized protein n=1 Tax=Striga asiatica TaxID=4170 RepID=A0A5A7PMP4_STRAF|nr:hypothetical protein STAS_10050 [Striga asiatica]
MASACVNNNIGMSPENFIDCPPAKFPSYGWLSPRISFGCEFSDEEASRGSASNLCSKSQTTAGKAGGEKPEVPDLETSDIDLVDFEFPLEDPVAMLPADELFTNGKLVPLQLSAIRHAAAPAPASSCVRSPDTPKSRHRSEASPVDPYMFSPKAPRCSSRWKELLGLKKLYQNSSAKEADHRTASSSSLSSHGQNRTAARGLKHLLQRSSKSSLNASSDSSLSLPLLKDSDNESVSISARLSLSSSSSGPEHDDLPRLSLDSDKPSNLSRVRIIKHRAAFSLENPTARARVGRSPVRRATAPVRGVSMDSPRMNSSGKIVFHSLERSSSSPSSFTSGPRYKHRGMERSYSANVRVTPVLNVPVYSLRGTSKSGVFGLFSSQQKKENKGGPGGAVNRKSARSLQEPH